jgi:hypothetical protein
MIKHLRFLCLNYLIISLTIISCSTNKLRKPSSNEQQNLTQIISETKEASDLLKKGKIDCTSEFDYLYNQLFNLTGDSAYLEMNDVTKIDSEIKASFLARLELKSSLEDFSGDENCHKSRTDVFRALRYVEDYLIELRMQKSIESSDEFQTLTGEFPYFLINPKFQDSFKSFKDLNSGDIILSRGNAFSSAAIARIGVNDYQFSHLSFVFEDPNDRKLYTTEAHIEIGSVTAPIIEHIDSKNARTAVFRYKDPQISHLASQSIYQRVNNEIKEHKKTIQYDFSMDFQHNDRLYCSEIISSGFKMALPNEDYFPMFKSKFSPGIIPFLNKIGIPATKENVHQLEVFAPGDIQFDPRFELVAEWRDPRKIEQSRLKDFILTKIFERMEKYAYKIYPSLNMEMKSRTIWLLRRAPVVRRFLENKFPLNMTTDQMELFMSLDKIGDELYKKLETKSLEFERPMTPKEIFLTLDDIFNEDFELYKRYKTQQDDVKPLFHAVFHP